MDSFWVLIKSPQKVSRYTLDLWVLWTAELLRSISEALVREGTDESGGIHICLGSVSELGVSKQCFGSTGSGWGRGGT